MPDFSFFLLFRRPCCSWRSLRMMPIRVARRALEVENHYRLVSMAKPRAPSIDSTPAKRISRTLRCITMIKIVTITTIRINTTSKIRITTMALTLARIDKHLLVESRVNRNFRKRMPPKNPYRNESMNRIFPRRVVLWRPTSCRILICGIHILTVPSRTPIN